MANENFIAEFWQLVIQDVANAYDYEANQVRSHLYKQLPHCRVQIEWHDPHGVFVRQFHPPAPMHVPRVAKRNAIIELHG